MTINKLLSMFGRYQDSFKKVIKISKTTTKKATEYTIPMSRFFVKSRNSYRRYQDYNLVRQTRVSSTQDSSVTLISKYM